jgi:hypothetical protein
MQGSTPLPNYAHLLTTILRVRGDVMPDRGQAVLFIWRDKAHIEEWRSCQPQTSSSLRIATILSSHLPMLNTDPYKREEVSICCIATGTKLDFSDVVCLYYALFQPPEGEIQ